MRTPCEIIKTLYEVKATKLQEYKVSVLGLYGSYARQEQTENSDIDLWVIFNEIPSLIDMVRLREFLELTLNLKVELVRKDCLRCELEKQILNDSILIWNDSINTK